MKSMFPDDAADLMPRSDGSNGSKEADEESKAIMIRKRVDAVVSKVEMKYLSVSESDGDGEASKARAPQ